MKKKIAVLMVAAAMVVSMMVSCGTTDSKDTASGDSVSSAVSDASAGDTAGTSSVNVGDIDIAEDWKSWQIAVDGVVYTLPCEISELENNGWRYNGDEGDLEAKQSSLSQRLQKDDSTILVQLLNMSDKKIPISSGKVGQIQIEAKDGVSVVLPGKLVFDENITVEAVKAKYGEPAEETKDDDYVVLKYNGGTDQELKFFIYNPGSNKEKYSYVILKNFGVA